MEFLPQNGYDVRIDSIENCGGPQQVLTIDPNTTVHMTNDCGVVVVGCSTSTGFQKAMVRKLILNKEMVFLHSFVFQILGWLQRCESRRSTHDRKGGFMRRFTKIWSTDDCNIANVRIAYQMPSWTGEQIHICVVRIKWLKSSKCFALQGRKCTTEKQKLDISKYKNMMSLARGKVVVSANIQHDSVIYLRLMNILQCEVD